MHYLEIKDIVRLERACCSKASHQHFLDLIPHSPAIELSSSNYKDIACLEWFAIKHNKIKSLTITLPGKNHALHVKNLQVQNLDLCVQDNVTMDCCNNLFNSQLVCQLKSLRIYGDQNKEVIEQLSLLTGNIETLDISGANNYKDWLSKDILSKWKLKDFTLCNVVLNVSIITLIVQTCSELTSITLYCSTADDAVVMAIAQNCPKLERLNLRVHSAITYYSILALSERGLPLKELGIPYILNIPTADIAKRCSHALSRIRTLNSSNDQNNIDDVSVFLPYMTGLTSVYISTQFPSYISLLTQYCHKLTDIRFHIKWFPLSDILSLCRANPLLQTLFSYELTGCTDTILIDLIHACPHLHTLYLPDETEITDIGILALSEDCPHIQLLGIQRCNNVTEAAVLQLLQCCHKLTRLVVSSSSLSEETWTQLDKNTQKRVSWW